MSGSTIGGVIGFAVGSMFGAPQLGFMLGSAIGGYLDPQTLQGPKLGDIPVQTSQEGVPRPIIYGSPQPFPGNIIQCGPKIISTKETEQGKGGGAVIESEEVHQTYAIRICEGPATCIQAWRDGKLVYDISGNAVFDAESSVFSANVVMYPGNQTQVPSPALEALPAANGGGVGNVPAYRGTAYMVIENDNLTGTGGRIPQFTFRMASATVETDTCEEGLIAWWPLDDASPDGIANEVMLGNDGQYSDNVNVESAGTLNASGAGSFNAVGDGAYMQVADPSSAIAATNYDEWSCSIWFSVNESAGTGLKILGGAYSSTLDGRNSWAMFLGGANGLTPGGGWDSHAGGEDNYILADDEVSEGGTYFLMIVYEEAAGGTLKMYLNGTLVKSETGMGVSSIGTLDVVQVGSATTHARIQDLKFYGRALSASEAYNLFLSPELLVLPDAPTNYVDQDGNIHTACSARATTVPVYLSEIELDIAARCGLTADQFDVSEITGVAVEGYLLGKQMPGAEALRPLASAYFHDLPEYDLQIHARRRGDASVVTLTDDDFVDSGEDEEIRAQAIELPRKVNLHFSDPAANYVPVVVPAERTSGNIQGTGVVSVELPLVLDRDEAKQKAEIMLRCIYEESFGRLKRELPAFKYAELVASDPIAYDDKRWRIDTLEQLDATIRIEAVRDRISNYESAATANDILNPSDPLSFLRGPSILKALNLPRLRSQDNQPGMYLFCTGVLSGWAGADIFVSADGGATELLVTTITARATMGELDVAIDADDEPITAWIYDNRNLLTVTPEDLVLRRNAFAIDTGGTCEVGQFQTADETVTDNHWDLTDVLRGQLDTTAASHSAGDSIVMLDSAMQFLPLDISLAGQTLIFRAVTRGTPIENNPTISVVFAPLFTSAPPEAEFIQSEDGVILMAEDGSYLQEE